MYSNLVWVFGLYVHCTITSRLGHYCFSWEHLTQVEVMYRVSQKKVGLVFRAHFRGFNGLKSKSGSPETPLKIQFYLLGSVFSPVYNLYTPVYTMYTM